MGKIEKVVVLSVLFLMVVIFAVSIPDGESGDVKSSRVYAAKSTKQRLRSEDPGPLGMMPADDWRDASGGEGDAYLGATKRADTQGSKPSLGGSHLAGGNAQVSSEAPDRSGGGLLSAGIRKKQPANPVADSQGSRPVEAVRNSEMGASSTLAAQNSAALEVAAASIEAPSQAGVILRPEWDLISGEGLADTYNPEFKTYACEAGDTFEGLAERFFGDRRNASFLRRNNEGVQVLARGTELLIPCVNVGPLELTYVVQPGDSLWTIAGGQFGDGSRWKEIYEANRGSLSSPDALRAGQSLIIP